MHYWFERRDLSLNFDRKNSDLNGYHEYMNILNYEEINNCSKRASLIDLKWLSPHLCVVNSLASWKSILRKRLNIPPTKTECLAHHSHCEQATTIRLLVFMHSSHDSTKYRITFGLDWHLISHYKTFHGHITWTKTYLNWPVISNCHC